MHQKGRSTDHDLDNLDILDPVLAVTRCCERAISCSKGLQMKEKFSSCQGVRVVSPDVHVKMGKKQPFAGAPQDPCF